MNTKAKAQPTESDAENAGLTKFDAPILKAMGSTSLVTSNGAAFLPQNMGEAMELGKLMASSNFVPPHLRGKPGDCLAVVLISSRWAMDPYAVAGKTYFVNDRIAYEAQLVNAVLNTRAPLDGRLQIEWDGVGQNLICKVTGRIKGDPEPHSVWQEIATIKVKNSPLWHSSPRQQIAYYTSRMWARLYCPEVLLGVYTEDEMVNMGPIQEDGSQVIPPRPTKAGLKAEREAADRMLEEARENERRHGGRGPVEEPEEQANQPEHDSETGEIKEAELDNSVFLAAATAIIEKINKSGSLKAMNNLVEATAKQQIEALPEEYRVLVEKAVVDKRAWFAK